MRASELVRQVEDALGEDGCLAEVDGVRLWPLVVQLADGRPDMAKVLQDRFGPRHQRLGGHASALSVGFSRCHMYRVRRRAIAAVADLLAQSKIATPEGGDQLRGHHDHAPQE